MNNLKPFFKALEKIKFGKIKIELPSGEIINFSSEIENPKAHIKIKNINMVDECLVGGDIALGESFIKDEWESENLPDLLLFFALNSDILENFFHANKVKMIFLYIQAILRMNTKNGSKKNIEFHYDLGNDFYKLWLDETMTYSSAIFDDKNLNLFEAQKNKYQRILNKIDAGEILEIGCGWGGFAFESTKKGNHITGLTLSKQQEKYSNSLAINNNFADKFQVKLQDYRDEKGKYDNIVSIEMFEAVGKKYWDSYFKTIRKCLKKGGKAIIQTITISEEVFSGYKNRVDFIQKHIFPGGILPSKKEFVKYANINNLEAIDQFEFGFDYQKTLLCWLENFTQIENKILNLGFDQEFIRKWKFYLSYCAAGFGSKRTDVVQFELI